MLHRLCDGKAREVRALLTAVLTVVLTFLLTGLFANRLVQGWQHRNWISQQRLADTQKDYQSLQDLFDEIAGLAGKRHHRMVRLLASIRSFDADVTRQRFTEYDSISTEWNERLNAIFAKLTMYLQYDYTWRLEHDIHHRFVTLGSELERLARQKISGRSIDRSQCIAVQRGLNSLQATVFIFIVMF